MQMLESIAKIAGLAILFTLIVVFAFIAGIYVLSIISLILAVCVAYWALGVRITITEDGKKIGYVRWFTFHKTE